MPLVGDVGEAAPAVGDFLVLGERIQDQRELRHVVLERVRQRLRGVFTLFARAILQEIQRRLDGQRLARHLEPQVGDGGVELAIPRRVRRHRFFVKQLLDAILELVRPIAAHVFEPRPVMAEHGIGQRRIELRLVDAVELELEEQQVRRGRGHALLHVAVELGARRIDGIALMDEHGIGAEPAHAIADRLIAPHRFAERGTTLRRRGEPGELALVGLLEGQAVGIGALEVALDGGIVEAAIERAEVPFGQRTEPGRARFRFCDGFSQDFWHALEWLHRPPFGAAGAQSQGLSCRAGPKIPSF
jgi:hypothetical protein